MKNQARRWRARCFRTTNLNWRSQSSCRRETCSESPAKSEETNSAVGEKFDIFLNPDGHGRGKATLSAFRFHQLKALIDESSRAITADKCVAWENHSVTYNAVLMEDIM